MKVLELIGAVVDTIFRVVLMAAIIYVIFRGAQISYDYGYRVFTEPAMSATGGRDVNLTVPMDMSAVDLGKLFQDNGLSRDWKLFVLQYYGSEYREYVQGGSYTFNTTMTTEEMMEVMAQKGLLAEAAAKEAAASGTSVISPQTTAAEADTSESTADGAAGESADTGAASESGVQEVNMSSDLDQLLGNER